MNNCIGQRNIKYFVAFLWITSIEAIYIVIFSFHYVIWNIFMVKETYEHAIKYSTILFIGIGIGFIYSLFLMCYLFVTLSIGILIDFLRNILLIVSLALLFSYFWLCIGFESFEVNPMSILILPCTLFIGSWVGSTGFMYMSLVLKGLTQKEVAVMRREDSLDEKLYPVKCKNIVDFFKTPIPPSELTN